MCPPSPISLFRLGCTGRTHFPVSPALRLGPGDQILAKGMWVEVKSPLPEQPTPAVLQSSLPFGGNWEAVLEEKEARQEAAGTLHGGVSSWRAP